MTAAVRKARLPERHLSGFLIVQRKNLRFPLQKIDDPGFGVGEKQLRFGCDSGQGFFQFLYQDIGALSAFCGDADGVISVGKNAEV